ncbi:hypothetical protein P168DRAFT_320583 [Aspergillus campestris IBT 28561]|uniref:UBC core domain-containing protein n=1 Tax=Aspergillus campestris (strain IBT 28561) TaxID=1392248 RepID=A0A2I1CWM3_ASPC2|nr:uncharacterized protein P168DRAFT_320583 [Aspergillus campestris IBT 28561]PKY02023.1 hypothetical protein P168DRAFT_320583 [Aspergillus campestris IBT 28561]
MHFLSASLVLLAMAARFGLAEPVPLPLPLPAEDETAHNLTARSDGWAYFCDDANCKTNCQKRGYSLSNPGCFEVPKGRHSMFAHLSHNGYQYSLIHSPSAKCPCESKKACRILESFINPSITGSPGTEIPRKVLQNAKGLVIFTATRAGFLGSVRFGSGVMIARLDNGSWSAPSAIATAGVGFGGLFGVELTDLVFILNDARAVRTFSQMGSLTIGGNVSVATGPVGRSAEFSTGASLKGCASMFTYCKTKGLLGGATVEAGMILERRAANRKLYNCNITADKILQGGIRPPPEVQPLMDVLYSDVFYTDPQNKPPRDPHMPLYGAIKAPGASSYQSSEPQDRGLSPQSPRSDQQLQSPAASELHAVSSRQVAELPTESPALSPSELPTEAPRNHERDEDLLKASVPGLFPHLTDIGKGQDDSSIYFTYTAPSEKYGFDIEVTVIDIEEYPRSHTYFACVVGDAAPYAVLEAILNRQPSYNGREVSDFLVFISQCIEHVILVSEMGDDHAPPGSPILTDEDDSEDGVYETDSEGDEIFTATLERKSVRKALRLELRAAKAAGFKVGCLGDVEGAVIVSIACRVSKLGISPEALHAWNVLASEYLVLLIRYPEGYMGFEKMMYSSAGGLGRVQFHVGLCEFYKPSLQVAQEAFLGHEINQDSNSQQRKENVGSLLKSFVAGKSMKDLLNSRLVDMIRFRLEYGYTWTGVEEYIDDRQDKNQTLSKKSYFAADGWDSSATGLLCSDQCSGKPKASEISLILIAMQYTLRRFVKCPEFCLTCYSRIDAGFEAIKPFVCSKELCMFQYIHFDMGPSIEWEILAQPYVVDLLISFCYLRAATGKLSDFPTGLGLKVPKERPTHYRLAASPNGILDLTHRRLTTDNKICVKPGDCLALDQHDKSTRTMHRSHCCVISVDDTGFTISEPVDENTHTEKAGLKLSTKVRYEPYDCDLDSLDKKRKLEAIRALINTIPDVNSMKSFICSRGGSERPLSDWKEAISPPALYVLKWIVASNLSCIMLDEDPEHQVSGVDNYLQFRLAQGSPDKEKRFVRAVKDNTDAWNLSHPTLFAWHGSPVENWHSILREGLRFDKILHGRTYGNGVYMAQNFETSHSYCTHTVAVPTVHKDNTVESWCNSALGIQMAVSLNEVVNSPKAFMHCSNFCYVVSQLDWIQTRYLFVRVSTSPWNETTRQRPTVTCIQDPLYTAIGPTGEAICVPISVTSTRRDTSASSKKSLFKKLDKRQKRKRQAIIDDGHDSVATLDEDRSLLASDSEDEAAKRKKMLEDSLTKTDFRPGTLKESSLSLMAAPKYATSTANRALQQRLQATLKSQDHEPLHLRGWYIDPTLIDNVYQWIAELHTFDPSLPLAKDMKAQRVTSIVLEIRFPPQFPISPPFVRVIRPRFVMWSAGGGGHVTAGGAMCLELLTGSGWLAGSSIESILIQVRMALTNLDPVPARLDMRLANVDYTVQEAVTAYKRVCLAHGWKIPDDLDKVQW